MKSSHLHLLSTDEIQKIFPQSYYNQYANHLKILQFEKQLVEQQINKSHINFKPGISHSRRISSALPQQQLIRVKTNRYDNYRQRIDKNKQQLKRMTKYNNFLAAKLKIQPQRRNVLRSLTKVEKKIDEQIFKKMKAIQDMEFQKKQHIKEQARRQYEEKAVCKFIKKGRSASALPKYVSDLRNKQNNPQFRFKIVRNSQQNQENSTDSKIVRNSSNNSISTHLMNNNSRIKSASVGSSSQKYLTITKPMIKQQQTKKKPIKRTNKSKIEIEKKDLVLQTSRIRQTVHSMQTLKRYDIIIEKRVALSRLQNL